MSFRCEECGEAQVPRAKPVVLPVEFREKVYRGSTKDIPGWEVARETNLCDGCAADVKPSVEDVINRRISGLDLEAVLEALKSVGNRSKTDPSLLGP